MKNLRHLRNNVRFYCTNWAPNGTSDLVITDLDGQVIAFLDEFLFGPVLDHNQCGDTLGGVHVCFDEDVQMMDRLDEGLDEHSIVYPLTIDDVIGSIAVSPMHSLADQRKRLSAAVKGE